ncbi:PaaI family thioesterase [Hirschia baltica]|uniref:Thioesterase superfamily protein n=1 Tax=Hirschia baltica (strain ATCC 49814 / DSM 5838 / IFAM 1418) TaxID=582402 RepID=C6XPY6_HIRBI|nr:PaaI family thioesterase [Hirschia baltica]ACT58503.1 thioesterase superfamily protein [Hirschia baltica ATCC 49814]
MEIDVDSLNAFGSKNLPGLIGVKVTKAGDGWMEAEADVCEKLMAPNGFLHAGTVVSLADTACGYACVRNLPEGATGFTTIELKSNFTGTARDGRIRAIAKVLHSGKTTQLWEAKVIHIETDKVIAHFSCTQMVLWPRT